MELLDSRAWEARAVLSRILCRTDSASPVERLAVGHHFVKHGAQTEKVRTCIDSFSPNLLGRHVVQADGIPRAYAAVNLPTLETPKPRILTVPSHPHMILDGLQAVVNNVVRVRMVKAAAYLPADIEKIPDGKSFFARQHGGDAVPCTYSMAAQNWPSISPAPNTLVMLGLLRTLVASASASRHCSRVRRAVAEGRQLNGLKGDCLAGFRIVGFIDRAVGDFDSSLKISKGPIFVGICFSRFTAPRFFASVVSSSRPAETG